MGLRNHSLIKKINRARILNAIRKNSPVPRSKIAELASLDRKSITNFVGELLEDGLVEEAGKQENISGRPYTLLRFTDKCAIGIYIAPHFARGVLIDLYGSVIASAEEEYPLYTDLPTLNRAVGSVYRKIAAIRPPECGVGVCMPGIMDTEKGLMIDSVNIPCLRGVDFRNNFASIINYPLFFEEESRSIALAEKWFGAGEQYNDFVAVEVSGGIGAGIVNNRRLYKGAGQYAGEIGHVVITPQGTKCRCGNLGCMETYASERVIVEKLSALTGKRVERLCHFDPATLGRDDFHELMTATGTYLGQGLSTVVNILCPKVIILNGSVINFFGEPLLTPLTEAIARNTLKGSFEQTRIFISQLQLSDALGAATLPLSNIFEVPEYYYV